MKSVTIATSCDSIQTVRRSGIVPHYSPIPMWAFSYVETIIRYLRTWIRSREERGQSTNANSGHVPILCTFVCVLIWACWVVVIAYPNDRTLAVLPGCMHDQWGLGALAHQIIIRAHTSRIMLLYSDNSTPYSGFLKSLSGMRYGCTG